LGELMRSLEEKENFTLTTSNFGISTLTLKLEN
jgi:hypothetical protein